MTAFGLGAAYGAQRLATLQQKKKEHDEERHKQEVQEAVAKALAARDLQEEIAKSMSLIVLHVILHIPYQYATNNFLFQLFLN